MKETEDQAAPDAGLRRGCAVVLPPVSTPTSRRLEAETAERYGMAGPQADALRALDALDALDTLDALDACRACGKPAVWSDGGPLCMTCRPDGEPL